MSYDIALAERQSTVNQRCLEIIKEIVSDGRLATVEFVVQVLLHRHCVSDFVSLNVGTISDIPSLLLLVEIYRKVRDGFLHFTYVHCAYSYTVPAEVLHLTLRKSSLYFCQSNSFISCYFGSRSIISYLDLESELVEVLRTFMIPSVSIFTSTQQLEPIQENADPNEINVDDPEIPLFDGSKEPTDFISCFNDYGIGPLYFHPSVTSYFPDLALGGSTETFVTSSDILGCLASSESDLSSFLIEDFESYLREEFGASSLLNIGIIIAGNLKLEIVMISHVNAARIRLLTEIQRSQLEEYAHQERKVRETTQSITQNTRQRKDSTKGSVVNASAESSSSEMISSCDQEQGTDIVKDIEVSVSSVTTSRPGVSSFVSRCSALLSDSPYSPSFSKVLDAVETVCRGSEKDHKLAGNKRKKRSRGRKTSEDSEMPVWETEKEEDEGDGKESCPVGASTTSPSTCVASLQEIVAEYVMLHLGGEKYRSKRLHATASVSASASASAETVSPIPDPQDTNCTEQCESSTVVDSGPDSLQSSHVSVNESKPEIPDPGPRIPTEEEERSGDIMSESVLNLVELPANESNSGSPDTYFECRLSSYSSRILPKGRQQSSSVYVVDNEALRDLAPWCGVGTWTVKSGGVLDTNDLKAVGRWGEALVYQYLLHRSSPAGGTGTGTGTAGAMGTGTGLGTSLKGVPSLRPVAVEWMNSTEETKAVYDVITRETRSVINTGLGSSGRPTSITETTYIEVKTTRFDDLNTFEISLWEWMFATANPKVRYHVYRVFNAGDTKKVRIVVIEDILEMITARKVRLCLNIQ